MKTSLITDLREFLPAKTETGFAGTIYNWSKPLSWPELRHITPQGALSLLICDKYPYFACQAVCQGGYKAILDGTQYNTYASGEKCSFALADIQESGTLTDSPEPLTIHTLLIVPAGQNAAITAFKTALYDAQSTESQGVLWAHFNLPQALSLANCFCGENLTNPLLQAITAQNDLLKITSAEYAFAQTANLRYLPQIQGETLSANAFKGTCLNTAGNNTLKQLKITSTQSAASAQSFAQGCLALKEIKITNSTLAPTDISNIFKNCQNLRCLPPLNFANTINAEDFLENCSALEDTSLDFSAAHSLNKLSIGATQQTPLNTVKSVLVSQKAPFDAASPQIDISYTGLDRNALINLFNSLPYNYGYELVGDITVNDAIASGFSTNNYLSLNATGNQLISHNSFEVLIKLQDVGATGNGYRTVFSYGFRRQIAITNGNAIGWTYADDNSAFYNFTGVPSSGVFYIRAKKVGNTLYLGQSSDGITFTETTKDYQQTPLGTSSNIRYGISDSWNDTNMLLYIKDCSITVDENIPLFRGNPLSTKICSLTGCSASADLSAQDKTLATSKGWEILE